MKLARWVGLSLFSVGCTLQLQTKPAGTNLGWQSVGNPTSPQTCYKAANELSRYPIYIDGKPFTILTRCVKFSQIVNETRVPQQAAAQPAPAPTLAQQPTPQPIQPAGLVQPAQTNKLTTATWDQCKVGGPLHQGDTRECLRDNFNVDIPVEPWESCRTVSNGSKRKRVSRGCLVSQGY